MILSFDPVVASLSHQCEICQRVVTLAVDPAAGDLVVTQGKTPHDGCITTRPCPGCGSVECLRTDLDPVDAGERRHPLSLVGTHLPGGNEVIVDTRDRQQNPLRVAQARYLRAMQAHPHLAPFAPRHDTLPH